MPVQIQAPDGSIAEFPDGTPDATIKAVMARSFPPPKAAPAAPKPLSFMDRANDAARSFSAGLKQGTASVADTVAGFIPGLNVLERATQGNPVAPDVMSHPTGTLFQKALGAFDPSSGYTPKTTVGKYTRTVGQFAPAAAAPGSIPARAINVFAPAIASEGAGQIAEAMGAPEPVVRGAKFVGAMAGGGLASARVTPGSKAPVLNSEDLRSAKTAAYDDVTNSGIVIKPQAMQTLADDVGADLKSVSLNPARHPKAVSMLEDIQAQAQSGEPVTLTGLDQLRQVVRRDVARASDGGEAFMGKRIIAQIDKFTEGLGAKDVAASGNIAPEEAAGLLQKARDLNTRFRKVEAVEDALKEAGYQAGKSGSGGNIDNATRSQMHRVLKSIPNLTEEEQAALDGIILGGKGQDLLRHVGKLSPGGSGLMTILELGTGHVGMGAALTGLAAKIGADKITKAKVSQLVQLMANGGTKARVAQAAEAAQPALTAQNPYRLPPLVAGGLSLSLAPVAQASSH